MAGKTDNLFPAPTRPCLSDSRTGTSAQLTDVESSSVSYVATDSSAGANDTAFLPADVAGGSSTRAAADPSAGANDPAFLPADAAGGSSTRAATDSSASANDPAFLPADASGLSGSFTCAATDSSASASDLSFFTDAATQYSGTESSSSGTSTRHDWTARGKHRIGYKHAWESEWPWLQFRENDGMFCTLCIKHNANSRCKSGVWVIKPCTLLRQDKVRKHANSDMHKGSKEREALAAMALADGGIEHTFEKTLQITKKGVEGAMKILYWLSKNEVAHFTKFEYLKDLCIELGCTYLKELNVGGNAKYTSHRIISEWLGIMS